MVQKTLKHKPYSKLKGCLAEKGVTQKDIAKIVNISHVALNKKINGSSDFTYSEVEIICNFLKESTEIFRTTKVVWFQLFKLK